MHIPWGLGAGGKGGDQGGCQINGEKIGLHPEVVTNQTDRFWCIIIRGTKDTCSRAARAGRDHALIKLRAPIGWLAPW